MLYYDKSLLQVCFRVVLEKNQKQNSYTIEIETKLKSTL